jgi:hypothetical protein
VTLRIRLLAAALLVGCMSGAPAAPAQKLQLYVMPDTQSWTWNQGGGSLAAWRSVTEALCRQRSRFAMVLHTGDMVDRPRANPAQWETAFSVMKRLDACGMPYAIAFGNHDYDNYPPPGGDKNASGDSRWKELLSKLAYQPAEKAPSGRGGIYPLAPGWFVLTMTFYYPPPGDLAWISAEIAERKDARFLLLHHDCINAGGIAYEWCAKLLDEHPEIRIAVSGHWLGQQRDAWRVVSRPHAGKLIALYQNYQHVPDLAAWGVVIELDPRTGGVCVWSEDPVDGKSGHPAASAQMVGSVQRGAERRCFEGS